jgi:hypothetical protein
MVMRAIQLFSVVYPSAQMVLFFSLPLASLKILLFSPSQKAQNPVVGLVIRRQWEALLASTSILELILLVHLLASCQVTKSQALWFGIRQFCMNFGLVWLG